ncbi:zinc finger protein 426-like [Macrobrachium nipponense]|uniref:zinc finger protein 426-like n=1 Tax=Macrobrachium nipponense TaxID=159736 RepID=UPI0030C81891
MNVSDMGHYVCSLCNISFGELSVLHLHMGVHVEFVGPKDSLQSETPETNILSEDKESEEKEEYQCKVCHKFFSDRIFFSFHNLAHYEGKSFQCKICGSVFSSKSGVYNHVCSHISEKLCRCTRGHLSLQGKDDQPRIFESADDLLKCGVCDGGFSTKKRLENHIKKHKEHSCPICKTSYNGPLDYEKHMRRHFQVSVHVFRCEICFETFCDRKERDHHMRIHQPSYSEEMNPTGQTCVPKTTALKDGKSTDNHEAISEEKISKKLKSEHTQESEKNFGLDHTINDALKAVGSCKKRSDLRSILKVIGVSHGAMSGSSEKAYKQSDGGSLVNISEINIQNFTALKSKRGYSTTVGKSTSNNFIVKCGAGKEYTKYECKLCFKVWRDKPAFWHHLVEHSEDVPYTCKICVEIFDGPDSWERHIKRKCGCALCGKLIKRVNYGHHSKVCHVSNPFKCLVCIKRFSSSDVFREHMKTHSKERSCRCKVCGEVLLLKYEVEKHNKMHGTESVDSVSTSEDEEDPFFAVSSAKTSSSHQVKSEQSLQNEYIPYKETDMKMPISSIKTECDVESSALHTLDTIIVKEEPLFEEKRFFDDTGLTRNMEQNNLVIVTGEGDNSNLDESVADPLA